MKSKTLILMVVAVVCGLAAAYMTNSLLAQRDTTVKVLVAKQKYNSWTLVKDPAAMFEEQEYPKDKVPANYVKSTIELKNRTLLKGLDAGQVVLEDDLQSKDKSGLEAFITPGMVAMAVKVSAETAVGGFVQPNSRVDIIHCTKKDSKTDASTILEDILVRAVDLQPERQQDRPGAPPATVTVEVTKDESIILTKALEAGSLRLALRPSVDAGKKAEPRKKTEPKPEPKEVVVKAPPKPAAPELPPATINRLRIFNSNSLMNVTHVTVDGETVTEVGKAFSEEPIRPRPTQKAADKAGTKPADKAAARPAEQAPAPAAEKAPAADATGQPE